MPLTPEQAEGLFAKGQLDADTARKFMQSPKDKGTAAPVNLQNPDSAVLDPNIAANKDMGRSILDRQREAADLVQEKARQKELDQAEELRQQRIQMAKQAGVPMEQIVSTYGPETPEAITPTEMLTEPENEDVVLASEAQGGAVTNTGGIAGMDPYGAQMQGNPVMAGYDAQIKAIRDSALVGQQAAAEENAYLKQMNKDQQAIAREQEAAFMQKLEKQEEAMTKLMADEEEISEMRADPKKYWDDKSTGDKILAGIAMVLGATGGVVGKGNTGVQAIESAMEKDLKQQEANIASAKSSVDRKKGIVSKMMDIYGDQRLAMNAARASTYKGMEIDLNILANKYKGKEIAARANELAANIGLKKAEAEMALKNQYAMMASYQNAAQGAPVNPYALKKEDRERYIPGYGFAASPEEGRAGRKTLASTNRFKTFLQQIINLREQYGSETLPTEVKARAQSLATQAQLEYKNIAELGVLAGPDMDLIEKVISSDPTSITSWNELPKLREAIRGVDNSWRSFMQSQGMSSPMTQQIQETKPEDMDSKYYKASAKR